MSRIGDLSRLARTVGRVAQTRYPAFVLGRPLGRDEIPVFTFHDVDAEAFARDLEYLQENGYRTLGLDEYLAARERRARVGRAVLLTFDDARASFWRVVLPLLRAHDARAVLFVPTFWVSPPEPPEPELFMSWQQVRACAESGLVDVQSHAHRHALVLVSPRLVDFAAPEALERFDVYDWPMRMIGGTEELGRPALGTPIYRAEPLLSARRRFIEDDEATLACRALVAGGGGAEFFADPEWRRRLAAVFRAAGGGRGRFATPAELDASIASELECSRERFRDQLGYAPDCIAYPWRLGSRRSLEHARRCGFKAAFGVGLDFGAERRGRLPIPVYGRLKCDWLQFLPGRGRRGVLDALGRKLAGWREIQHLAH